MIVLSVNAETLKDLEPLCEFFARHLAAAEERPEPVNDVQKRVNDVIDDLSARRVSSSDRARLRGAVDKADAPLTGRAGADAAIGRAIR